MSNVNDCPLCRAGEIEKKDIPFKSDSIKKLGGRDMGISDEWDDAKKKQVISHGWRGAKMLAGEETD